MRTQFTFTTKQPQEIKNNEILLTRATRSSKKDGKEIPAAFKPMFAVAEIPPAVQSIEDEFIKLAALSGLQAAYQKAITQKLPADLLKSAAGAEQTISITEAELKSILSSEAGEARRITKEAITEAWKIVVSNALRNLCKLRGVQHEKHLPDNVRRQVGVRLQKRADFLLSLASTTGVQLYSEEQLTSELEWLIALVEKEQQAADGSWIFSACLDKVSRRLEKLAEMRASNEQEEEEEEELVDLDSLI